MPENIFISYSHHDRHLVPAVTRELRKRGILKSKNVTILDSHQLVEPGHNMRALIMNKMRSASKVVIIESKHSAQSQWVNYEAGLASALDKPIFVVGTKGAGRNATLRGLQNTKIIEIGGGKGSSPEF